jgi:hypothetical protein
MIKNEKSKEQVNQFNVIIQDKLKLVSEFQFFNQQT